MDIVLVSLMSALAGLGVDNIIVELSSAELPIMDGSAGPFVFLLQSAGIVEQDAPKRFIRVLKTVEVTEGDKVARFSPYEGYKLGFTIQFDHPMIPAKQSRQEIEFSTLARNPVTRTSGASFGSACVAVTGALAVCAAAVEKERINAALADPSMSPLRR